jgi:hypothetical protein
VDVGGGTEAGAGGDWAKGSSRELCSVQARRGAHTLYYAATTLHLSLRWCWRAYGLGTQAVHRSGPFARRWDAGIDDMDRSSGHSTRTLPGPVQTQGGLTCVGWGGEGEEDPCGMCGNEETSDVNVLCSLGFLQRVLRASRGSVQGAETS